MTFAHQTPHQTQSDAADAIPRMPSWATAGRPTTSEDAAFLSGAALALLHHALAQVALPQALLRARLALTAAEACVAFSGRPERVPDLRDALALLRPGDQPGPAGAVYRQWWTAVSRPISVPALKRAVSDGLETHVPVWQAAVQGGPVQRAAAVLEAVLTDHPADEASALILADAALARSVGWSHLMPLLAGGLKRRELRLTGADLITACHSAVIRSSTDALGIAADLTRRAAYLRTVTPKLRAKWAGAAVEMFLTQDALAPAALTSLTSDRAARRLCDRLVDLGAVRELTGRDTFRLYGV
ncbi:DUF1403 family protein [Aliiroseovarius sp. Z3]|uniref:DUF1403 family protein n=1 Tax=Aliiroseovarius sp. Z3 TaxID=2811402 RepID=UPI0023B2931D|nr:DUF1403 family protein [Aliiroseovarius sp. Z3]MDE9451971.1 DUF1403 family protein [Aliiroseovarius sp. Z3]